MTIQIEGRRLAFFHQVSSIRSLVGWCEAANCFQVAKNRVNAKGMGVYQLKEIGNLTKNAEQLSSVLSLGKGRYSAQHCSLTQRRPKHTIS